MPEENRRNAMSLKFGRLKMFIGLDAEKKDRIAVIVTWIVTFILTMRFDVFEIVEQHFDQYEYLQIDDLLVTLFVATVGHVWYANRRLKEYRAELARRIVAETSLTHAKAKA